MGEGKVDLNLGKWCDAQRQNKKKNKLSQERIQKLNDIHFDWGKTKPTKHKATSTSSPQQQKQRKTSK